MFKKSICKISFGEVFQEKFIIMICFLCRLIKTPASLITGFVQYWVGISAGERSVLTKKEYNENVADERDRN